VSPTRSFAAVSLLLAAQAQVPAQTQPPAHAQAQEHSSCLARAEQRAAIAEGRAIPLAVAKRMLRQRIAGELLRARLCPGSGRLVYMLTVLTHDGKVRHVTVDATNGTVIGGL
jgi:uncharacterized membrane protein YkoI